MELAQRYVTYLREHCVVVCRKCKYALHPGQRSIRRHFCTIHRSTPAKVRKAIGKYTGTLSLTGVKDVIIPSNSTTTPIVELEVHKGFEYNAPSIIFKTVGGFKCIISEPESLHNVPYILLSYRRTVNTFGKIVMGYHPVSPTAAH